MFKKNNIISKLFVSLIVVAFSLTTLYLPFKVEASQIETRAVYNYTVSEDHVLNDGRSYVTVKLTISHNMNTNQFFLTGVKYTSYISPVTPTLKITSVSTTPKKGGEIKGNYVTVTVKYSIPGIGSWEDNFNIVI